MAKIQEINYKSDFSFILDLKYYDKEGTLCSLGFPEYDFKILLYTNKVQYKYIVSYDSKEGIYGNCKNVDNKLVILVDNAKFTPGKLYASVFIDLPNDWYEDNKQQLDFTDIFTNIRLTKNTNISIEDIEIQLLLPFAKGDKGDKGDPFKYEDFTEEQLEELQKPAVDAANTAYSAAEDAYIAAQNANEAISKIEEFEEGIQKDLDKKVDYILLNMPASNSGLSEEQVIEYRSIIETIIGNSKEATLVIVWDEKTERYLGDAEIIYLNTSGSYNISNLYVINDSIFRVQYIFTADNKYQRSVRKIIDMEGNGSKVLTDKGYSSVEEVISAQTEDLNNQIEDLRQDIESIETQSVKWVDVQ